MTKTIEFIEKEIEYTKKKLERLEIDLNFPFRKDVITHLKENLQTLEQIKCELEAWHLAKTGIYEGTEITGKYHDKAIKIDRRVYVEGTEQYKTFKKALEAKNE